MIIVGIVVYTINLPKTAAELNGGEDDKQLPCIPVSFRSLSYQNGTSNVNDSAAVEVQVASSHDSDVSCTDQLMSRHDSTTSPHAV